MPSTYCNPGLKIIHLQSTSGDQNAGKSPITKAEAQRATHLFFKNGPNRRKTTQSLFLRCFLNTDNKLQSCAWLRGTKPDCTITFNPKAPSTFSVHQGARSSPLPAPTTGRKNTIPLQRTLLTPRPPPDYNVSAETPESMANNGPESGGGGKKRGQIRGHTVFRFRHFRVRPPLLSGWALDALGLLLRHLTVCTTAPSLFPAGRT